MGVGRYTRGTSFKMVVNKILAKTPFMGTLTARTKKRFGFIRSSNLFRDVLN